MAAPLVHAPTDKKLIYCLHIHIKWLAHIYAIFSNIRLNHFYAFYANIPNIIICILLHVSLFQLLYPCAIDFLSLSLSIWLCAFHAIHSHYDQSSLGRWNVHFSGICWSFEKIAFDVLRFVLLIRFALGWSPIYIIAKLFVRKSHDSGHVIYLFHIIFFSANFHIVCSIAHFFFVLAWKFHFIIVLGPFLSFTLSSFFAFLFHFFALSSSFLFHLTIKKKRAYQKVWNISPYQIALVHAAEQIVLKIRTTHSLLINRRRKKKFTLPIYTRQCCSILIK